MASRITQSLSFHQSPESFIAERLQKLDLHQRQDSTVPIVRADILNRNVHIISSYRLCKAILGDTGTDTSNNEGYDTSSSFAAGPAYEQLMAAFFPRPNILLEDGPEHRQHKSAWQSVFQENVVQASIPIIQEVTIETLVKPLQKFDEHLQIDIYETMKRLAWDILIAVFLGFRREDDKQDFRNVQDLQEKILVGQFSLFPMSIRTPFWTSARRRGLKAVRDLGPAIRSRLVSRRQQTSTSNNDRASCPFLEHTAMASRDRTNAQLDDDAIISHTRLFASSIANKALASLLTAYILNLFLWHDLNSGGRESSLAHLIRAQSDPATRTSMLKAILRETERLSPPVIGVMRRATETVALDSLHSIPVGHDAWLYFVAANRDPEVFGKPDTFQWDRFMGHSEEDNHDCGLAFGSGAKRCLGADLAHQTCVIVAQTMLDSGVSFDGKIAEQGVLNWLGWQTTADVHALARDVKQLPCQRPRRPVMLRVRTR